MLIHSDGANGKSWAKVAIPATIQSGNLHNNAHSRVDFRGEGFPDGAIYRVRVTTKNIDRQTGRNLDEVVTISDPRPVENPPCGSMC